MNHQIKSGAARRPGEIAVRATASALAVFTVATGVFCAAGGNMLGVMVSVSALPLLFLPAVTKKLFRVEISPFLTILIMLFSVLGSLLGTGYGFYRLVPYWDNILHVGCGFFVAMIGFALWDTFCPGRSAPLAFRVTLAFTLSVAMAGIWELYEFAADTALGLDMQCDTVVTTIHSYLLGGDASVVEHIGGIGEVTVNGADLGLGGYLELGLIDTMVDLVMNTAGAAAYALMAALFGRRPDSRYASVMLPRPVARRD